MDYWFLRTPFLPRSNLDLHLANIKHLPQKYPSEACQLELPIEILGVRVVEDACGREGWQLQGSGVWGGVAGDPEPRGPWKQG